MLGSYAPKYSSSQRSDAGDCGRVDKNMDIDDEIDRLSQKLELLQQKKAFSESLAVRPEVSALENELGSVEHYTRDLHRSLSKLRDVCEAALSRMLFLMGYRNEFNRDEWLAAKSEDLHQVYKDLIQCCPTRALNGSPIKH